jgi:hypothetical protein
MFPSMRWTTLTLLLFGCAAQPAPDRRPTEPVLEVVWKSPGRQRTEPYRLLRFRLPMADHVDAEG